MKVELSTDISEEDLCLLYKLYTATFPPEERREWQKIASPSSPGRPALFVILADGKLAGMLTLWDFDTFSYIEHLAVHPDFRAMGVGSQAIKLLQEKIDGRPLVVEIEPPCDTAPQTISRKIFYERLGFSTITSDYIQPPYAPGLPPVGLHLMATTVLPVGSTTKILHKEVYNATTLQ